MPDPDTVDAPDDAYQSLIDRLRQKRADGTDPQAALSETVSEQKAPIKKMIEGWAGDKVSDEDLQGASAGIRGAASAASKGVNPAAASFSELKQAGGGTPAAPEQENKQKLIATAISAAIPTLLGTLIGGVRGGAIGAHAGTEAAGQVTNYWAQQEAMKNQQAAEKRGEASKEHLERVHGEEARKTEIVKGGFKSDVAQEMAAGRNQNRNDALELGAHKGILQRLDRDKVLQGRLTQYQNLDNALANVANAEHLTPQQIDEAQQAIRSNMGLQGNSGVSERAHTYFNSLGLNADRWMQFLTGNPADIAKDSQLVKHLQDLARLEQGNIHRQFNLRVQSITSGHESIYARRPDLRADLSNKIAATTGQIGTSAVTPGAQGAGAIEGSAPLSREDKIRILREQGLIR